MTNRIYEFRCMQGHVTDSYTDEKNRSISCKLCGNMAARIISPVLSHLDVTSGHFPGATAKWARDRERKIQLENKANQ